MSSSIATATIYAEYLGYRYDQEIDDQGDNVKLVHSIVYAKTGRHAGYVDCSPYSEPSLDEVRRQIEHISECNCEQVAAGCAPACYESATKPVSVQRNKVELDNAEAALGQVTPPRAARQARPGLQRPQGTGRHGGRGLLGWPEDESLQSLPGDPGWCGRYLVCRLSSTV